jgi:hypothetical protein
MDNFFTGSHANVAHHLGKPNFELLRHDIVEPILLEARARPHALGKRRRHGARVQRSLRRNSGHACGRRGGHALVTRLAARGRRRSCAHAALWAGAPSRANAASPTLSARHF